MLRTLSFGDMTVHPDGCNLVIDASSADLPPEPEIPGRAAVAGGHSGVVILNGFSGMNTEVTFPNITKVSNGAGEELLVYDIVKNSESDPGDDGDSDDLRIGGVLRIPADCPAGAYSGTLKVTVTVN